MSLTAYADADHAGYQDTRRSTSGSAQFLGDKLVRWSSKKQKSTAISSTEAEYIALSAVKTLMHFLLMKNMSFLRELRHTREINSLNDVFDHMHQPWRNFVALINKSSSGKTTGLDKLPFSRAQILW
nr:retrovirus-related Pol polyprotein from transposon TNT 1-94 [Tanacetum cinerariifolium]